MEKQLEALIQIIRIHSQDIGLEFCIKMCLAYNEKWEKEIMQRIELPNQERFRTLEEKINHKYLAILERDISNRD